MSQINKETIMNVDFDTRSLETCLKDLINMLDNIKDPYHIITANPEIVMQMNRDPHFKSIQEAAKMITPDGIGIVWASKIFGGQIRTRLTGVDLLEGFLGSCEKSGHSMGFLGGNQETIELFEKHLKEKYPKLKVVFIRNGYFDVSDDKDIVDQIAGSNVHVLVTGMGSPRAQKWFDSRRYDLNIKMTFDVGGGFDALSGTVKRAPKLVQFLNLEWLYRRIQNPSRKERQKDLYRFGFKVLKMKLRGER